MYGGKNIKVGGRS